MRRGCIVAIAALTALFAGCAQTTRVDGGLNTTSLAKKQKGVALIKIGMYDKVCTAHIAVRQNDVFQRVETVRIVEKGNEPTIGELELDPGEYHVVSYMCQTPQNEVQMLADPINQLAGLYRTSYATFTVEPGEIVNVGALQIVPRRLTKGFFVNTLQVDLKVTDWNSVDHGFFERERPNLYGQMKTRLMTLSRAKAAPPSIEAGCALMRKLRTDGRLVNLPPECATPGPAPSGIAKKGIRA